ncbi:MULTISPECIES: COX15/CtaA family protein [unclassified Polaromonas]|jgi:cytochrome c oxidase assembly protein subunit 15|uniref:COX15/CtaA family protein n=1 Tax=unclassified Polaromonas TaxID=2638319 RepID=UPI000BCF70D0|nr:MULTISPECIES: COX15/CtaA family protein [unclassified Polaromonas]OYY34718.1 MAG: heme A synthase [Polaromonas sp. 35-63-35]OYZ19396.1 MAG: heme A synthase [Polaromonas sp. 16-63-31]OYZ77477.1 MAG: heme A synthase [Polaromonas sp. 24-63-21]OZA48538.1 MAG: heme A synthase [Polaromonas sp. 17-63-33]OZA87289.1 MAG: heme A synthase [Polaromonas sp. 39-63-25]
MDTPDLYNLSPALRLMGMGLVLALGPLAWVWLRNKNQPMARRLRLLTLVTLFLTFDLVLFGAFTRLTDSGLGCPDWPGCYGHASPVGAQHPISAAQAAMPSGPVTHGKAWIEMIHRYLATGVGVLILTLAIATWLSRRKGRGTGTILSPWWPMATLVWVCVQGAFGALTVTMKLFPLIVTLHLLGGLVLLALLRAQAVRYAQAQGEALPVPLPATTWLLLAVTFALLWLQIALGGWVSTNYAVLACTDFPACQGSFWPQMDFREGFTLWRALGAGLDGDNISFQALTAIHYVHRLTAYVVFAALLWLASRLRHLPAMRSHALWIAALALWQFATGLSNVVLGWPLVAAVSHTGGAAALVVVLTGAIFSSYRTPELTSASKLRASSL